MPRVAAHSQRQWVVMSPSTRWTVLQLSRRVAFGPKRSKNSPNELMVVCSITAMIVLAITVGEGGSGGIIRDFAGLGGMRGAHAGGAGG